MKIYGNPMSTCTRRVLMTLAEKQAKYEMVTLDFMKGEHKSPAHLARQPFGQMPALEDGDLTLFESRAMMRYIDETVPGQALTPKDPKTRALMNQWWSVESEDITPPMATIVFERMFTPMRGGKPDAAKIEEAKKKLAPAILVLDTHLGKGGPHLVGDSFTLADISFMPYLGYFLQTPEKDVVLSHKNVAAWWKRISERPAWKSITEK